MKWILLGMYKFDLLTKIESKQGQRHLLRATAMGQMVLTGNINNFLNIGIKS